MLIFAHDHKLNYDQATTVQYMEIRKKVGYQMRTCSNSEWLHNQAPLESGAQRPTLDVNKKDCYSVTVVQIHKAPGM